jgi:hypothetical protein
MVNDGSGRPETESRRAETTELLGEKGKAGYMPHEDLLLGIGGLDPKPHFAVEPLDNGLLSRSLRGPKYVGPRESALTSSRSSKRKAIAPVSLLKGLMRHARL